MKEKRIEFSIEKEIEKANALLEGMAGGRQNFKFLRNEENEKNCVVTYECDCNIGNVKGLSVTFNPFLVETMLEGIVVNRLKDEGFQFKSNIREERLLNFRKHKNELAENLKIPEPKE